VSPRAPLLLALVFALLAGCTGKRAQSTSPGESVSTRVGLDRTENARFPRQEAVEDRWRRTVFPPRFFSPVMPVFPSAAVADRVPSARVRVDFTVGTDGLVRDARAELLEEVPHGQDFAGASLEVLARWRFSPAWRLPREGESAPEAVVVLDYDAHLVFRFDLEVHERGGEVGVEFSGDPRP
jgi:hypothetical protein